MIFTFYSYKGGVGRSMALANVAEYFYLHGLRVAMVDWDLEAPGLENYFYGPSQEDGNIQSLILGASPDKVTTSSVIQAQSQLGLIDMLLDYQRAYPKLAARRTEVTVPVEETPTSFEQLFKMSEKPAFSISSQPFGKLLEENLPPLSQYLHAIHPPAQEKPGELWLLPAGWRAGERFPVYAKAVQDFDWEDLYISFEGKEYFDWMRAQLSKIADVVLIDSRTGVTEMGGVCACQMADVVVSFCAPNSQNLEGVRRMISTFTRDDVIEARGHRPLGSVVVPSRVETKSEERLLNEFRLLFRSRLETRGKTPQPFQNVNSSQWELQIPYVPKYSFGEKLVIGSSTELDPEQLSQLDEKEREERLKKELERALELEKAYSNLALHLALLAPEGHSLRRSMGEELRKRFPALYPQICLSHAGDPAAASCARELRGFLESRGLSLWPDLDHSSAAGNAESAFAVIAQAMSLVLVISQESAASEVLRHELRYARQQGKCTWLVLADASKQSDIPPWLQGIPVCLRQGWEGLLLDLQRPCGAMRAPMMAPPLPEKYVDRPEESQKVKEMLMAAAAAPGITHCVIWGQGGSGKTVLLTQACQDGDVIDAFPGGILWVMLGRTPDVSGSLNALCSALTGQSESPVSQAEAISRLHMRLSNRNFLLVLDDVWDDADLEPFRSIGERCTLVITTRDLEIATKSRARTITIGELTHQQSVELLTADVPLGKGANPLVDRLIAGLQSIPLMVSLARVALDQSLAQGQSPDAALEGLQRRLDLHGVAAFDQAEATDRSQSVTKSLAGSLVRLRPWERLRLLQLASTYRNAWTPVTEVYSLWQREPGETDEPRERGETKLTARQADLLLQRLCALWLMVREDQTQNARVDLLVYRFLESQSLVAGMVTVAAAQPSVSSSQDRATNQDVKRAREILGGDTASFDERIKLARTLAQSRYFGYARRIQGSARRLYTAQQRDEAERRSLAQKHAMYTYKDTDLPAEQRFQVAFDILGEVDELLTTKNQETLGLAGAICKYQWGYDAQVQNLERSLGYYRRGYAAGIRKDLGYTAINAAFVLDLLASREEAAAAESGATSQAALERREEAARIRQEIIQTLTPLPQQKDTANLANDYWFLATIGEAYFGLRRYDDAAYWLREAAAQKVEDWQAETTARQLATLACTHNKTDELEAPPAWKALRVFLLNDSHALQSIAIGKVGLALSGGGFRASLFHVGVLARLAELDVLRHVEVLSCVSGGSIVGAYYYLEVRHLLETKRDNEVTRQDYIDIVQRIERQFLAGVQRNLRTRILAEWITNVKTIFLPRYSRTERLAELYEEELYARVPDSDAGKAGRLLNKLQIKAKDEKPNFLPKQDNWRRAAKVPQLVINSSTLNTGHNWQFTASFMGEPPGASAEIDGNERLRRMYYWEAPAQYQKFPLGRAVAASACLPGLFEPVEMDGLFPERTLQLVDGGVHDNQGVGSLLEQECSVLLVSDASGQMVTEKDPSQEVLKVPMRANAILMARVREAEYRELQARQKSQLLRGLMFVHLKKGLDVNPVDWVDCKDPQEPLDDARPAERRGLRTAYDVPKDLQEKLAGVRTDLDSFSDREAYGLMWSGYKMTDAEFSKSLSNVPTNKSKVAGWQFQQIERVANRPQGLDEQYAGLLRALDVGKQRGLKIWRLSKSLRVAAVLVLLACVIIIWMFRGELPAGTASFAKRVLLWAGGAGLVGFVMMMVVYTTYRLVGVRKPFSQVLTGAVIVGGGFLLARLHLWFFDPAFLNEGRIGSPRIRVWRRVLVLVLVLTTLGTAVHLSSNPAAESASTLAAAAYQKRQQNNPKGAIADLTQSLNLRPDSKLAAQIYSDRALCYKLTGDWDKSIADITAALSAKLADDDRVRLLNDRAYAYLQVRQPEAALADYTAAHNLDPKNSIATSNLPLLTALFTSKERGMPDFFVFMRPESIRNGVPPAINRLWPETISYLNLKGWENPIPENEVRYSHLQDKPLAQHIVDELTRGGLVVKGPVLMSTPPSDTPVIELWLAAKSQ